MSLSASVMLTSDREVRVMLRRKLEEYKRRLAFQAPEVSPHCTLKKVILERLLTEGRLDQNLLGAELSEKPWFDTRAFVDAFGVISAYNANNMSLLRGGTGLR